MYNSKVVTGKIIEIRDDHVVTLQGDTVSTYHLKYYMMTNEEILSLPEAEAAKVRASVSQPEEAEDSVFSGWLRRERNPLTSWIPLLKKSANRA
ncbi:hypothetical protein [Paenibacillus lemnae]|uniref:Uncharacterized protein n=1 Tax=Paenibacillus lemnae TaxID=1330551 RepID=A0A848MDE2_PAELE|nr:hypothetical protein [Paenibacillus lemnae]NMO98103.1 hypothetical protein [Paenibacillus lemnae]